MPTPLGVVASHRTVTGPAFDPLSIPWHSAFWTSDPLWTPPADGTAVASWRNAGTQTAAALQGQPGTQPTYRAAYANLNGKPAIEFTPDGTGQALWAMTELATSPNHIFAVGWLDPTAWAESTITDGSVGRHLLRNRATVVGDVLMYAGSGVITTPSAGRVGPFTMAALFNGSGSKLRSNGTNYTVSGDVGSQGCEGLSIGGYFVPSETVTFKGGIAFVGVSDVELTAQQLTDLDTWAKNFYGVPIP